MEAPFSLTERPLPSAGCALPVIEQIPQPASSRSASEQEHAQWELLCGSRGEPEALQRQLSFAPACRIGLRL